MNHLRFLKLKFDLSCLADYHSINYIGNKLRGALGKAMVHSYCVNENPICRKCKISDSCIYSQLFKPIGTHPEFDTSPAPFTIGASQLNKSFITKGERLSFYISIFGNRLVYWKELVLSVIDMFRDKQEGFNRSFDLISVSSVMEEKELWENGDFIDRPMATVWSDCKEGDYFGDYNREIKVLVEFQSALLMKEKHKKNLNFGEFIDAVFYRIASITDLYEEKEFVIPYGMLYRKPYVKEKQLDKGSKLAMIYSGICLKYLPYIEMGSHLHIGKKSTYGFGEYQYKIINSI